MVSIEIADNAALFLFLHLSFYDAEHKKKIRGYVSKNRVTSKYAVFLLLIKTINIYI